VVKKEIKSSPRNVTFMKEKKLEISDKLSLIQQYCYSLCAKSSATDISSLSTYLFTIWKISEELLFRTGFLTCQKEIRVLF
jgi:hypothetical protein